MKISQLIEHIKMKAIAMPEFQREYVWNRDQAKKLMTSLIKEYPVGSLLFWTTNSPPELKNMEYDPETNGVMQIILDGQQRLTTLYLLITGDIPPYYTENDIQTDPRNLYYNLETQEFQYYQALLMRSNPVWVRVVDVMQANDNTKIAEIARNFANNDFDKFTDLVNLFTENKQKLLDIQKVNLPELNVPASANMNEAIDIFDLVNSQGTKLTEAELALTHMTGHWAKARRVMKKKLDELSKRNFKFDLNFLTRALTGVVTHRALFETVHTSTKEELESGWKKLERILDYMVRVLSTNAFIHSTNDVNTSRIFIPWIVYLSHHDGKFPNDIEMKHAIHWLYLANIWGRYTGQTEQKLEYDISVINRNESPWNELRSAIIDQRGRIEVQPSDLQGRGAQHPLFRMLFLLVKAHGGVDWFNGIPLNAAGGEYYGLHSHHIFPQSVLYQKEYDSNNHLHQKIVNEIANRAFLTAPTNIELSNTPPAEYLPIVQNNYANSLVHQFIPINRDLWQVENYEMFLEERRKLIAKKINEYLEALIVEPEQTKQRTVLELIELGENVSLEFKSTLQWDVIQEKPNPNLRHSVLKTITAFLNSDGGTLVIGVEDNGGIYGLKQDLKLLQNSTDKFLNLLNDLIVNDIGAEFSHYLKMRIESTNGHQVCLIDVDASITPAFLKTNKGKIFYVRVGTTTRGLDPEETVNYINTHWTN